MSNKTGSSSNKDWAAAPKTPGEERKRQCPKCREATWHTYGIGGYFHNDHYWKCNKCGNEVGFK